MGVLDGLFNRIFKTDVSADDADAANPAVLEEEAAAIRFVNATITRVPSKNRIDVEMAVGGGGGVSNVTGTAPITVVGTTTKAVSIADAAIATAKIADAAITLAKLANLAAARVIGSVAGGVPAALTPTQVTATMVEDATTTLPGRLSAAFWNLLNEAHASTLTGSRLVRRDSNGDFAGRYCTAEKFDTAAGRMQAVSTTLYVYSDAGNIIESGFSGLTLECRAGDVLISAAAYGRCVAGGDWQIKCGLGFERVGLMNAADEETWGWYYPLKRATTSTADAVPTGFTITPGAEGGAYEVQLRATIGTDRASWRWVFDAFGTTAVFTAGAVPVPSFWSTAALAGFGAALEESGATIRCRVQPDTASSVTWSLRWRRVR